MVIVASCNIRNMIIFLRIIFCKSWRKLIVLYVDSVDTCSKGAGRSGRKVADYLPNK